MEPIFKSKKFLDQGNPSEGEKTIILSAPLAYELSPENYFDKIFYFGQVNTTPGDEKQISVALTISTKTKKTATGDFIVDTNFPLDFIFSDHLCTILGIKESLEPRIWEKPVRNSQNLIISHVKEIAYFIPEQLLPIEVVVESNDGTKFEKRYTSKIIAGSGAQNYIGLLALESLSFSINIDKKILYRKIYKLKKR